MDRESVNRYIHSGHRKAILKAQEVMRNQEDQDRIVPERQQKQRESSLGRYVVPQFDRTMEQDMLRRQRAEKYGFQVNPAGYEEYEEVETYTVHPAVLNFQSLGDTMTRVYGTSPLRSPSKRQTR